MKQARQNSSARRVAAAPSLVRVCLPLLAAGLLGNAARAQTPTQQITGPTRPQPVPLSGRAEPANPVTVLQQTTPAGTPGSVDTLNTTVTVQGPYAGSRPDGTLAPDTLPLTLDAALKMGLRNNLGRLSQDAGVQQAEGQRLAARSALLPNINIGAAEVFSKENLRTAGLKTSLVPPSVVFNYDDLRGLLQQSVLDLVSIHQFHGATEQVKSTVANARNARDLIVLAAGGTYLQLTATRARLDASNAQVEYAKSVFNRARDQYDAGLAAKLDATRAEVQLETEEQRSISLQADLDTQSLRLARIIGLPIGQKFVATDVYGFQPLTGFNLDTALERAMTHRQDLVAAAASMRAAEAGVKAARSERLPSVAIRADAGIAGVAPTQTSLGVYTVQGIVTIPVYNGGRIAGDEKQADAARTQRRAEYEDARAQVDQDVRQAFIQLNAAESQVKLAERNRVLAHESLTQSVDRFVAGVTDTVEVVQAEQAVVQADDEQITALYEHNLAKLSLARAMGAAEETLPQLLRK
ncbi:TolC family protein [Terriglobus aquaticus]|uniref:TolC family protein n=1 Tax=Terriglobus aquaticus TaxID=940139 RepID=A0ABW9KJ32_9BACT|nr:TolC family protein [Terriglobus aquaticus]